MVTNIQIRMPQACWFCYWQVSFVICVSEFLRHGRIICKELALQIQYVYMFVKLGLKPSHLFSQILIRNLKSSRALGWEGHERKLGEKMQSHWNVLQNSLEGKLLRQSYSRNKVKWGFFLCCWTKDTTTSQNIFEKVHPQQCPIQNYKKAECMKSKTKIIFIE